MPGDARALERARLTRRTVSRKAQALERAVVVVGLAATQDRARGGDARALADALGLLERPGDAEMQQRPSGAARSAFPRELEVVGAVRLVQGLRPIPIPRL